MAVNWPFYLNNMTTSASTNVNVWQYWNTNDNYYPRQDKLQYAIWREWATGTTATTIQSEIWQGWNIQPPHPAVRANIHYPEYAPPPPPTPEQIAAREKYQREQAEIREARRLRAFTADERAKALLMDHLDDQQKRDYEEKQAFDVEVDGKTYRVGQGTHGNVREIVMVGDKEVVVRRFCIPSRIHSMPEADVHLSQMLMIEGAMDEFERIANVSVYRDDLLRQDAQLERELAEIR